MIFLSHNSDDKPTVRRLYKALTERGVTCWFDEQDLPAGGRWQDKLEQAIRDADVMAVCLGPSGMGPWQEEEYYAALTLGVREKKPVVPVILPGVLGRPDVPLFLASRTWVDLRPEINAASVDGLVAVVPDAEPESDALGHLLVLEFSEMRSLVGVAEGKVPSGLEGFGTGMRETNSSEAGSDFAAVIDSDILTVILENLAGIRARLKSALGDQGNSQQAKDEELAIAKSRICAELRRVRDLNDDRLPVGLERDWRSYSCC